MTAARAPGDGDFTRQRLAWLDHVAVTPGLSATAKSVAMLVAVRYLSRSRGCAWPSGATLAAAVGVDRKSVLRAIDALEAAGLLEVTRARGRGRANEFRLRHDAKCGAGDTFSDPSEGTKMSHSGHIFGDEKCPTRVPKNVPPTPHQPLEQPDPNGNVGPDGAGAHSARPAPAPTNGPVSPLAGAAERAAAAPHVVRARAATLEDLLDLEAEELAAERARLDDGLDDGFDGRVPDAIGDAGTAFFALHPDELTPRLALEHARELLDALLDGDAEAQARTAERARRLLAFAPPAAAAAHKRIVSDLLEVFARPAQAAGALRAYMADAAGAGERWRGANG